MTDSTPPEILERLTRLETKVELMQKTLDELSCKINGYFENRVRSVVKSMLGEVVLAVASSAAFITFVLTRFFR